MTPAGRLMEKVTFAESGCWLWTGAVNAGGYGRIWNDGKLVQAHRLAFEIFIVPVPDGLDIDHLCRERRCVNPWHLEVVTRRENLLRGDTITAANAAKKFCPKGHRYDAIDGRGARYCRTCSRERWRNAYHRRKAANA